MNPPDVEHPLDQKKNREKVQGRENMMIRPDRGLRQPKKNRVSLMLRKGAKKTMLKAVLPAKKVTRNVIGEIGMIGTGLPNTSAKGPGETTEDI